jgi:hypothetical protein
MKFIHQHSDYIASVDGRKYVAQVYAAERGDHTWEAWCVFFPARGDDFVTGDYETTQNSAESVRYWASGLTHRFFEGALERALSLDSTGRRSSRLDERDRAKEAEAYALAGEQARDRAHEIQVMQRAMRRGIRVG